MLGLEMFGASTCLKAAWGVSFIEGFMPVEFFGEIFMSVPEGFHTSLEIFEDFGL